MAHPRFVDREAELDALRSRYDRDEADLLVVYGRRRLGKSALVRESTRDREDAARGGRPDAPPLLFLSVGVLGVAPRGGERTRDVSLFTPADVVAGTAE